MYAIVETPLQLLCAIEAKHYYDDQNFSIVVRYTARGKNDEQIRKILLDLDVTAIEVNFPSSGHFFRKYLNLIVVALRLRSNVKVLFLGSAFSKFQRTLASLVRFEHLWYLDDGFATLSYDSKSHRPKLKANLFTMFDDWQFARGVTVVPNQFSWLRSQVKSINSSKSYFIGQPLVEREFLTLSDYLHLIQFSLKHCQGNLVYIPHRVECDEVLEKLCKIEGLKIEKVEGSVEWYFIVNGLYPKNVYGINSTALFTLSKIFPETKVFYFSCDFKNYPNMDHLKKIESCLEGSKKLNELRISET